MGTLCRKRIFEAQIRTQVLGWGISQIPNWFKEALELLTPQPWREVPRRTFRGQSKKKS